MLLYWKATSFKNIIDFYDFNFIIQNQVTSIQAKDLVHFFSIGDKYYYRFQIYNKKNWSHKQKIQFS